MNALLICPSPRPAVSHLSELAPLAAVPLLGESLLEYWLTDLALAGVKQVRILADDRPEQIAALIQNGARWGITVEVSAASRELAPAQAQLKYAQEFPSASSQDVIATLDHFPGVPGRKLFNSYAELFAALTEWMPKARTVDRVGVRELRPGIWVGMHAHISPEAELRAPCWIGRCVYVGARAIIGPGAVVEDRSFVEGGAEIANSVVGRDTFVGQLLALQDSFALGHTLANWKSGACTKITDAFLLSALRRPAAARHSEGLLDRLVEIYSRNKEDLQMFWKHFLMNKEG